MIERKVGDTVPLVVTLERDGLGVPLGVGDVVTFRMAPAVPGEGQSVTALAEVVLIGDPDYGAGKVRWRPTSSLQVANPGLHRADFKVIFADGEEETFPNEYLLIRFISAP